MNDSDIRSTKDRPGWLIPYLTALDRMFYNRWGYWFEAVTMDQIPEGPIPYVSFQSGRHNVRKNIDKCLNYAMHSNSNVLEKFIDWLLWGFHYKKVDFPDIDEKIDDFWYRTFNLSLFYQDPADHFAGIVSDHRIGSGSGYFPTPASVVEMMTRITFGDKPLHEHKNKSVIDPCCGTGIMLLCASNYSLNLYGMDIQPFLCKIVMVNAYIYVPWIVYRPEGLTMFDDKQAIIEMDLPTGIRIPMCTRCNNKQDFILDVQTDCILEKSKTGLLEISNPTISQDIINKKLKPENISCAKCDYKETT